MGEQASLFSEPSRGSLPALETRQRAPEGAFDVYVAPEPGQPEPSGPLPVFARCIREAEQIAATAAGTTTDRCLALPARNWSDNLIELLSEENRRADESIQRLRQLHAGILGCSVEELDQRMAAYKAEEERVRREPRASAPARSSKGKAAKGGDAIGIGRAALSERQRQLLAHVRVENNLAVYTSSERIADWDLLKRVMVALGGTWKTGGKKAPGGFRFPDDVDAAEVVRLAQESGEITDPKAAELFETPLALGSVAVERLAVQAGMRVLEPSAGRGALVRALLAAETRLHIEAMEAVDENIAGKLAALLSGSSAPRLTGVFNVVHGDFLLAEPGRTWLEPFDRVLMNPPFSKRQDIKHVRHAYKFLGPGGVLVAIMSSGVQFRDDKLATEFRAWVAANDGEIWRNPPGSFEESGTSVNTCMVRVRRSK